MDYQELNLKSGDVLTAAHMAHIEKGIDMVTAEVAKIKTIKIILRNDSTENWAAVADTFLLSKGEPAIEFDETNKAKIKIGDGVRVWGELPYFMGESESGNEPVIPPNLQEQITALEELVNSFSTRITNAESDASAAVIASEEVRASVDQL